MKRILILLPLLIFCSITAIAQNIQIKGKVVDEKKTPLSDLTVLLSTVKDSTVIQYATTNETGDFTLDIRPVKEPSYLTVSLIGYKDVFHRFENLTENKNLETISLESDSDLLSEIVIVTDAPIRVKNDTLEFNANSFKVRPDANVEALLKALPGVEIDADKKITVNGKEVSQILVNGKPFFSADGSVALQNLPADLIKKIQVTDHKTKAEEFSGRRAKSDNASINLTIDEKNNQGFMGKLMGGIGSIIDGSNRYESSGLVNYFKGDRKVSLLAMSNNINSTSFSMDEIFDNMGGGRSQMMSFGGRMGGPGGFRSNSGITRTNMGGINYADKYFKKLDVNASYYINDTENKNNNRSRVINLLPDGDFITQSQSQRTNSNTNHNANIRLEYNINPTTKLFINPQITAGSNEFVTNSTSQSMDANGNLFNENTEKSTTINDSYSFKNSIEFNKKIDEKGRNFSLNLSNNNSITTGLGNTNSDTRFYQDNENDDIRNQQEKSRTTNDTYSATAEYSQPIAVNTFLDLGYTFKYDNQTDNLSTYNFNESSNDYVDFNGRLSNQTHRNTITNTPFVGINFEGEKISASFNSGVNIENFNASALYLNNLYEVDRKFTSPYIRSNIRYNLDRSKSFNLNYNYNVSNPSATEILPYERLNDPLNTYIGNENLDQSKNHSIRLGFRNYNFQMRTGWNISINANLFDSQIVSSTIFDENRKRTTTYTNVSGAYTLGFFGNWNKSHKFNEHNIRYGVGAMANYNANKGYSNGVLYNAYSTVLRPSIYASWDYGELLTIAPSYNVSINNTKYENYRLDKTSYLTHNVMLQTTTYWPENFNWGNDFSYNYNTNIADGFKKDFFMWNTAISYTFLDKALTAKVKVYDLLNQNIGTSRTVTETSISDQENTVLERYVMFSLTWKFNKFGGSTSQSQRGPRMGAHPGMMRNL